MRLIADLYDESIKIVAIDNENKRHFIKTTINNLEQKFKPKDDEDEK